MSFKIWNAATVGGNLVMSLPAGAMVSLTAALEGVCTLSTLRGRDFHQKYGVDIQDGPLRGLTARGVVVLDAGNKVVHAELVPEIAQEPNYDAALAALKS